jgi:hypothetical protein
MSDESNLLQPEASATPHGPYFAEDLEPDFGLRAGVDKEEGGVCVDELLGALTCQSGADVPDQRKRSIDLRRMVLDVTRFLRSPKDAAGGEVRILRGPPRRGLGRLQGACPVRCPREGARSARRNR